MNGAANSAEERRPHSQPADRARRLRLPWWKKLLFSLLVVTAFFGLLEGLLAWCGVRPLLETQDPLVGFAGNVRLFVEQREQDGRVYLVTADSKLRYFNRQRFPRDKGERTYRIFCLGGSTTYGHPYRDPVSFSGWLREFLPAADPSREWEVINAGGISYASYRVALLMEELARYQPDLFIVYSGQNEFLEARTYPSQLATPTAVHRLHAWLAGTRVYALVRRCLKREPAQSGGSAGGRTILPGEVDAMLDHTVGPESYHRDDPWKERVLEHYRLSLARMAAVARRSGAKILYVTPASNLRDFPPFKSEHRADLDDEQLSLWRGSMQQAGEAYQQQQPAATLAALDQAAAIDDRYARLHFLRGRVLLKLDRVAEAQQAFWRACDEDICPLRALSPMRGIVARIAAQQQAPLIDFAALLEARSEHGVPGDDWFLDHVHPKLEGYRLLSLEIVEQLQRLRIVRAAPSWGQRTIANVTARVRGRVDERAQADAMRNIAKVLRWAGNFDRSALFALEGVAGLPDDPEAHYLAGDAWRRRGENEAAMVEYAQAVSLDPNYLEALEQLGKILVVLDRPEAARNYLERAVRLAPDLPDPHLALGNALYVIGDLEAAETEYRETVRLDWRQVDAHKNLAMIALRRQDLEQAIHHLEQALTVTPDDALVHRELGFVFVQNGQPQLAGEEFSLALLLEPQCSRSYLGLGLVAAAEGRPEEAQAMYRRAVELDPGNEAARRKLAQQE